MTAAQARSGSQIHTQCRRSQACRWRRFVSRLTQPSLRQVYTVVEHLVYGSTSLLYGRHLDQLLLAATYGVCKVHGLKQVRPLFVWGFIYDYRCGQGYIGMQHHNK